LVAVLRHNGDMTMHHPNQPLPVVSAITTGRPVAAAFRIRGAGRPKVRYWLGLTGAMLGLSLPAQGAGGHHAVDDAAMLELGRCQLESWVDRDSHGTRSLVHVGPVCRVGPVELGINLDRIHMSDIGATAAAGPQIKWARTLTETFSVGVVLGANWQDRSPSFVAGTVVFPLTWQAGETVTLHANIGRDFRGGGDQDTNRLGAALEWSPLPAWSFVAERFRESDVDHWRAGARYELSPSTSMDVSRAKGLHGSEPAWWTLGLTWTFSR
jgi:hypothetical protein